MDPARPTLTPARRCAAAASAHRGAMAAARPALLVTLLILLAGCAGDPAAPTGPSAAPSAGATAGPSLPTGPAGPTAAAPDGSGAPAPGVPDGAPPAPDAVDPAPDLPQNGVPPEAITLPDPPPAETWMQRGDTDPAAADAEMAAAVAALGLPAEQALPLANVLCSELRAGETVEVATSYVQALYADADPAAAPRAVAAAQAYCVDTVR